MKNRTIKPALLITALLFIITIAAFYACSKDDNNGGGNTTSKTVSIQDFAYSAATLNITKGTTVTWTNNDAAAHTVTADDGSFDSGNIASGATYTHIFSEAGTIAYHCTYHPGMKASVVVAN